MAKSAPRSPYNSSNSSRSSMNAPKASGLSAGVVIVTIILMALAGGAGYGAITVYSAIATPVASGNAPPQNFVVSVGDTPSVIASHLEHQKLIRNAFIFNLYLKVTGKKIITQPGTYQLSPSWHINQIIDTLNAPLPLIEVAFTVNEGLRLSQYPDAILSTAHIYNPKAPSDLSQKKNLDGSPLLPNFSKADFLKITVTDGTFDKMATDYWYVQPWDTSKGAYVKLEGYLFPSTYRVAADATALDIIKKMLDGFGEQLCPLQYIHTKDDCMKKQNTITPVGPPTGDKADPGSPIGVFDALSKHNLTLQQALIIASITQREARSQAHLEMVAGAYYNRITNTSYETVGFLNADPTSQYYEGSILTDGSDPWKQLPYTPGDQQLTGAAKTTPYNTYTNKGLPPSAISGPSTFALYAGIDPPSHNYYYFYFAKKECTNLYFVHNYQFEASKASDPAAFAGDCS